MDPVNLLTVYSDINREEKEFVHINISTRFESMDNPRYYMINLEYK